MTIRVLVACEFSGVVSKAFRDRGFEAFSCDLLPTEGDPRWHIQGDAIEVARRAPRWGHWDLMIAHPPCTHLAVSGARHFAAKVADGRQQEALGFIADLFSSPIKYTALENPVSIISSRFRKPDQIIQPWQFGHGETKATCLWLNGLPKLVATDVVEGREPRVHRMAPGPNRWKERSRTFAGIANAMADQWGDHIVRNMRASTRQSGGEWIDGKLAALGVLQSADDQRAFSSFHAGTDSSARKHNLGA